MRKNLFTDFTVVRASWREPCLIHDKRLNKIKLVGECSSGRAGPGTDEGSITDGMELQRLTAAAEKTR